MNYEINNPFPIIKINNFSTMSLLHKATNIHRGDPNIFDFKRLTTKFEALQQSLVQFNTFFGHIWYGDADANHITMNRGKYIVIKSTDDKFVWIYNTLFQSCPIDKLYINGNKHKILVNKWLSLSDEERKIVY